MALTKDEVIIVQRGGITYHSTVEQVVELATDKVGDDGLYLRKDVNAGAQTVEATEGVEFTGPTTHARWRQCYWTR